MSGGWTIVAVTAMLLLNVPLYLLDADPRLVGAWGVFCMGVLAFASSTSIEWFRQIETEYYSPVDNTTSPKPLTVAFVRLVRGVVSLFFRLMLWVGLACVAYGIALFVYQIVHLVTQGSWVGLPAVNTLASLGCRWAADPRMWLAFWQFLSQTPASIFMLFSGAVIALSGRLLAVDSNAARQRRTVNSDLFRTDQQHE